MFYVSCHMSLQRLVHLSKQLVTKATLFRQICTKATSERRQFAAIFFIKMLLNSFNVADFVGKTTSKRREQETSHLVTSHPVTSHR